MILCCCFYVLGKLVTFPSLGDVALCQRPPEGPSITLPSGHQYMIYGCLLYGLYRPFCYGRASYCGDADRQGWALALPCVEAASLLVGRTELWHDQLHSPESPGAGASLAVREARSRGAGCVVWRVQG